LDSTTIDLCLSVFPWAPFRSTKAAVKMHTLLDLRGNIPSFIFISDRKMHDVNILDDLLPEAGAFYIMDRGYLDFERLARLDDAGSFFVTRGKSNLKAKRRYSHPVDRSSGLVCDQTVVLTGFYSRQGFDRPLRRIKFNDPETDIPTISRNPRLPSLSFTNAAGRSSCFSNGSSSIYASKRSSAPLKTLLNRRSGSLCRFTS
jgi:Transposase DDE domain